MSTDSALTMENTPPEPPEPPQKDSNGQGQGAGEPDQPLPPTNRDMQRGALQDLIDLATQCANLESQLDVALRGSLGDTESGNQKALADLERNYKSLQDQIARKYEERAGQIVARYQQNVAVLKANDETQRRKAKHDFEIGQEDLKKKYDQAIWLAESVQEAAEGKAAEDLKKAQDQQLQQTELLDAKETEAKVLLDRYNMEPPASPAAAAKQAEGEGQAIPFEEHQQVIEKQLSAMAGLSIPNLFVGIRPYILVILLVGLSVAGPQLMPPSLDPQWKALGISAGSTILVLTVGLFLLKSMARKQVMAAYLPLRAALDGARADTEQLMDRANVEREMDLTKAAKQHKTETQAARDKAAPILDKMTKKREAAVAAAQAD